jgi:hypothetical protein
VYLLGSCIDAQPRHERTERVVVRDANKNLQLISERERERDVFVCEERSRSTESEGKKLERPFHFISAVDGWIDGCTEYPPHSTKPKRGEKCVQSCKGVMKRWTAVSTLKQRVNHSACMYSSRHILEASIIAENSQLSNQMPYMHRPYLPTIIILSLVNKE